MNKVLIHSQDDFLVFMGQHYWLSETHDYSSDWYYKSCFPDKYPCVVVHQHTWDHYRGRESYDVEHIYLSDFDLAKCEKCQKYQQESGMVWEYHENPETKIWDNGLLCPGCIQEIEGEA